MATALAVDERRALQHSGILHVSRILNALEDVILRLPNSTFETAWRLIASDPPDRIKIRIRFRPDLAVKAEFRSDGSADLDFPLSSKPPSYLDGINLEGQPTAEILRHLIDLTSAEAFGYAMLTLQMTRSIRDQAA